VISQQELEDPSGNRSCAPFEMINASSVQCEVGTAQPFEPQIVRASRNKAFSCAESAIHHEVDN
jgi:hypothetical protein